MKKKIKDITIGELNAFCRKARNPCERCPLTKACDTAGRPYREDLEEEEIEIPEGKRNERIH